MRAYKNPIHSSMGNGTCSPAYISLFLSISYSEIIQFNSYRTIQTLTRLFKTLFPHARSIFDSEQPLMAKASEGHEVQGQLEFW